MAAMHMFRNLINTLKKNPRKIVFTEGTDPRILEASARLLSGTFLTPVLIGNEQEILDAAEEAFFNIRGAIIIDPARCHRGDVTARRYNEVFVGGAVVKKGESCLAHLFGSSES